jgi:hypothetical protein
MKFTLFDRNIAGIGAPLSMVFIGLWAVFFPNAMAMATPVSAGIWRGDEAGVQLSNEKAAQLTNSLRRITGLASLDFAADGQLLLGDFCTASSGAAQAREILQRALESGHCFILEDHSGSPTVNFGQLDQGTKYEDDRTRLRLTIWRVRLDFDDFREMQACRQVRDAFDVGFAVLHELLHGLGHEDAAQPEEIGEIEQLLNQARAELGLPQRDRYFGEPFRWIRDRLLVRLRFRDGADGSVRERVRYVFFITDSPQSVGAE